MILMPTPDALAPIPDETTSETLTHAETWKELYAMVPKMREAVRNGIDRDQKHFPHDATRIQQEQEGLSTSFEFLRKKWVIDLIYILSILKRPYFNQIRKSVPEINSRTLTVRLKEFESQGIVTRTVEKTQPLHVYYELTELGQGIYELVLPLLFFYAVKEVREKPSEKTE